MYCPKCATQNAEDTKFCRSCGANLSLVPQALTGRLPEAPSGRRRHRNRDLERGAPANLAKGITNVFMGIGFLLVSFASFFFAPAGRIFWFWLLIPAFAMLGKGVAEIVSAKYGPNLTQGMSQTTIPPAERTGELPPRNEVLFPPPSVTEQTTRQLDPTTDPYRYRDTDAH
ncbi:MAG TPA: zinc ribbon domain-containing protein [Blastocatellia bacterium]|nr:zinc ribbon domain-containing protein [Blastocatellia bacterium]